MRMRDSGDGFTIWLSASDTYEWAHKAGSSWPCSTLAGRRIRADFDRHGLLDFSIDGGPGEEIDGHEFSAIVADFAAQKLPEDHPCYFVAVGQFI